MAVDRQFGNPNDKDKSGGRYRRHKLHEKGKGRPAAPNAPPGAGGRGRPRRLDALQSEKKKWCQPMSNKLLSTVSVVASNLQWALQWTTDWALPLSLRVPKKIAPRLRFSLSLLHHHNTLALQRPRTARTTAAPLPKAPSLVYSSYCSDPAESALMNGRPSVFTSQVRLVDCPN